MGGAVIEIDGSLHSGSGTILRYAVALASILGEPLCIIRIRSKRDKPGLRPQHLQAVKACCALSKGRLEGAEVGSQQIQYWPGKKLDGGKYHWDIGTAGSAVMLAFTLIPLGLFAQRAFRFSLTGGLFQDFAPSFFYMKNVLLPLIRRMGAQVSVEMLQPGYVPKGGGTMLLNIDPIEEALKPLRMPEQGEVEEFRALALASHLEKERVGQRMADQCRKILEEKGYHSQIEVCQDRKAVQKGASLLLWTQSSSGCILGSEQSGKPGRRSETIAGTVTGSLLKDLKSGATVDCHLADQLILPAALAGGTTTYRIPRRTGHVEANLWLVEKILGAKTHLRGNELLVEGIGLDPRQQ
jgi:RNA 3'-terminal phosphate cyclase (ATP)